MDAKLSWVPLMLRHRRVAEVAAVSLDFAMRFVVDDLRFDREWYLYETRGLGAGAGRSYSEHRVFDERHRFVASSTMMSSLLPAPPAKM